MDTPGQALPCVGDQRGSGSSQATTSVGPGHITLTSAYSPQLFEVFRGAAGP